MYIKKRLTENRIQPCFLKPGFAKSRAGILATILLGSTSLLSEAALATDWATTGGTLDGQRYSALNQINTTNVGTLTEDFSVDTGTKGSHMGEPLVVGSTLYVVTPFPNKLIAYDLANKGAKRWTYNPGVNSYAKGVNCCDAINRGAAYANGKIVFNLLDNTTVAVDAVKGTEIWRNTTADVHSGVTTAGAPIIVNGKVIVGTVSGEMGVRGWVLALDLVTGKELWRGYHTGPDKDVLINSQTKLPYTTSGQNTNLGQTSWPGNTWQQGGSSAWAYLTYDKGLPT